MLQVTGQLGGVTEDLSYLVSKGPELAHRLVDLVQKAGSYLPKVEQIVDKAGAQLPKVAEIVDKGARYIPTILLIVEDPALPLVVERVKKLHDIRKAEQAKEAASGGPVLPTLPKVGVGLDKVVKPLDAYIWTREHPWATKGVIALGLLGLAGAGFALGRWSKRR